MINACSKNGRDCSQYLKEMQKKNIEPNEVIYLELIQVFFLVTLTEFEFRNQHHLQNEFFRTQTKELKHLGL